MIRIECNCKVCKANGGPLAANVPAALVGLTKTAKGRHGLVFTANDPSPVGVAARKRINVTAA